MIPIAKAAFSAVSSSSVGSAVASGWKGMQAASVTVAEQGWMAAVQKAGAMAQTSLADRVAGMGFFRGLRAASRMEKAISKGPGWIFGMAKEAGTGRGVFLPRGIMDFFRLGPSSKDSPRKSRSETRKARRAEKVTKAETAKRSTGAEVTGQKRQRRERKERAPREPRAAKDGQERPRRPRRTREEIREPRRAPERLPPSPPEVVKRYREKRDQRVARVAQEVEGREIKHLDTARRGAAAKAARERIESVRREPPMGHAERQRLEHRARQAAKTAPTDRAELGRRIEEATQGARPGADPQKARLVACARCCEGRSARDVIAGIVGRKELAKAQVRDHVGMAVGSLPEGKTASDAAVREAAECWMVRNGMQPDRMAWAVYRHSDTKNQHFHVVFSRVRDDGRVWHCKHPNAVAALEARALDRDAGQAHHCGPWQPGSGQAARAAFGKYEHDHLAVEWRKRGEAPQVVACQGPQWAARRAEVDTSNIEQEGAGGWFMKCENFGADAWGAAVIAHCEKADGSARRL